MQRLKLITLTIVATLMMSCHAHRRDQKASSLEQAIPAYLTEPAKQLEYALKHYWDDFNFKDTTWLHRTEVLEDKFVSYFALLSDREELSVDLALYPLTKLDGRLLTQALTYYRRYFYDGDSPLQDDEVFRYVTIWAMSSPKVDATHQAAARELLKGLNRNRVGQEATDFVYASDTTSHRLLPIKQRYLLLVFGTPDCISCRAVQSYIAQTSVYQRLVEAKQLRVLTVYVQHGGERVKRGVDTLLPQWMERAYDPSDSIIRNRLYDIKSSPTIYLLSEEGKVLLRDPQPQKLTKYLEKNG